MKRNGLLLGRANDVGRVGEEAEMKWNEERVKLYTENVFPHLSWNDLLRFRRVSKSAKKLADQYIKVKGAKLCPEITIYEVGSNKDKCLSRYLELGFPTTRIYLMNTSHSAIFDKEAKNFAKFLKAFGPTVTHVRIHRMFPAPQRNERRFFEGLPNLECLMVDTFGGYALTEQEALRQAYDCPNEEFPKRFKQLKKFTVGVEPNILSMNVIISSTTLMSFCEKLEYSGDAFCSFVHLRSCIGLTQLSIPTLGMAFKKIQEYIEKRNENFPNKPNLKFYDFTAFHEDKLARDKVTEFLNSSNFLDLAKVCVKHSVKLLNVNAAWFQKWQPQRILPLVPLLSNEQLDTHTISTPVVSLVNLHGLATPMDMPNLEKLTVPATSRSSLLPYGVSIRDRRPWPALKVLDVTVDSKMLYTTVAHYDFIREKAICIDPESTASLMRFLFVGIRRPAVTEVRLTFVDGMDADDDTMEAVISLGACCSNVRKLTLVNWPGTNSSLIKIFAEVKNLEELCLEKCKKIGDLAFKKTDTTDGILSQLSKLKKLSLKELDKMPKCTDALFKDVLCRMKLTHLVLSSGKPLNNITPEGIRALKNGEFANSIEKFPFHGWSLAKLSGKNFKELEKEFRSHCMI